MIVETFYPCEYMPSVYAVPFEQFWEKGMRGVIFDIDNTLVPHGAPADERIVELFRKLREIGYATCLLSNNKENRVSSFAGQVESPYIFKAGKPGTANYKKAMKQMGTDEQTTLFVGDQLFTDVWGANRAGIYSILVKPIDPKEEIQIILKRYPEKAVLWLYERSRRNSR